MNSRAKKTNRKSKINAIEILVQKIETTLLQIGIKKITFFVLSFLTSLTPPPLQFWPSKTFERNS